MKGQNARISVKALTEAIAQLIQEEIIAKYVKEDNALQVRFLNGQTFRVSVEEAIK